MESITDPFILPKFTLPFTKELFPDERLFRRAQLSADMLMHSLPMGTPVERAERRGFQRLIQNDRVPAQQLLTASVDPRSLAQLPGDLVLLAEDTSLVRPANPPSDAGQLRRASDLGYVMHAAIAASTESRLPLAWLGAEIWTRKGIWRLQTHKALPANRKESRKWAVRRNKIHEVLGDGAGGPRRCVHLNDREGDCWVSLRLAVRENHLLITRVAQEKRSIREHPKGLRAYLQTRPVAKQSDLTITQLQDGRPVERAAKVLLRFAEVTLQPPKSAHGKARRPLALWAVWVHERADARVPKPIDVLLLTTIPLWNATDAERIARWYAVRWAVEIAFDLMKNGQQLEAHAVTDVHSFKRLVALTGPTAVRVAQWIAAARQSRPPAVTKHFDPATLRSLRTVCKYYRVPVPVRWSMRTAVLALGRLGGYEPRNDRLPGWRVVQRGWCLFEELKGFADFLLAAQPHSTTPPGARSPPKPRKTGVP
jgi:hypothetical protein